MLQMTLPLLPSVVCFVFLFQLLNGGLMILWHQESSSTNQNFIKWNKKFLMVKSQVLVQSVWKSEVINSCIYK